MAEEIVEDLGRWAEQKARELLELENYQYVNQNYHSRYGEIDLIVKSGKELVFVEVKARSLGSYATACEVLLVRNNVKSLKQHNFFYKNILIMMILIVVLM